MGDNKDTPDNNQHTQDNRDRILAALHDSLRVILTDIHKWVDFHLEDHHPANNNLVVPPLPHPKCPVVHLPPNNNNINNNNNNHTRAENNTNNNNTNNGHNHNNNDGNNDNNNDGNNDNEISKDKYNENAKENDGGDGFLWTCGRHPHNISDKCDENSSLLSQLPSWDREV